LGRCPSEPDGAETNGRLALSHVPVLSPRNLVESERQTQSSLDGVPPFELFGAASEQTWRWLHLEGREHCPFLRRYLPSLTGDPRYEERFVGTSGAEALLQGSRIYELFKQRYEQYANPLNPESRVLDFGCGWGRVIRFFLKDVAPQNLVGIDVMERAIKICRETNRWCDFQLCDVLPPSGLEPDSFDLIYAFSVFSHLSEEAHALWLDEFARLLRSSGVLVVTTFSRTFLPGSSDSRTPLSDDPVSLEERLRAYDRGDFVYRRLQGIENPHFGDAFIPERYVRERWGKRFTVQEYSELPEFPQNIIVCTKE
jgi:SAM-dependent methyltransferase